MITINCNIGTLCNVVAKKIFDVGFSSLYLQSTLMVKNQIDKDSNSVKAVYWDQVFCYELLI